MLIGIDDIATSMSTEQKSLLINCETPLAARTSTEHFKELLRFIVAARVVDRALHFINLNRDYATALYVVALCRRCLNREYRHTLAFNLVGDFHPHDAACGAMRLRHIEVSIQFHRRREGQHFRHVNLKNCFAEQVALFKGCANLCVNFIAENIKKVTSQLQSLSSVLELSLERKKALLCSYFFYSALDGRVLRNLRLYGDLPQLGNLMFDLVDDPLHQNEEYAGIWCAMLSFLSETVLQLLGCELENVEYENRKGDDVQQKTRDREQVAGVVFRIVLVLEH